MSVNVPGAYRWVSWRPRYSPELVAAWLPTVWGNPPAIDQEKMPARCIRGAGKCMHTCAEDQYDEGCVVDGDHKACQHRHGGHAQCGKCLCLMPTDIRSNRGRESDSHATRVDIERAWRGASISWQIAEALALRHQDGHTQEEIALIQGVSQQAVSLRLRAGHMALADYLNGAWNA